MPRLQLTLLILVKTTRIFRKVKLFTSLLSSRRITVTATENQGAERVGIKGKWV